MTRAAMEIRNPADRDDVVGTVMQSSPEVAAAAVEAAAAAASGWAAVPLKERCELLREGAAEADQRSAAENWVSLLTREQGKILPESMIELGLGQLLVEYCTSVAEEVFAEDWREDDLGRRVLTRVPLGVVSAITPWNWPVGLSALKIIPALLCGNAVVLKPAPWTPLTVSRLVEAFAGVLPEGVLNVVHGDAEVGGVLTRHPAVRKVSFTGSTATGSEVMREAAATVKSVTLELGGNDPAILLDDVAITDELAESLLTATFTTTGQVCMAVKRIYVHESRHDEFLDAFSTAVDRLVVGNGLVDDVTMGPLNNRRQFDRVTDLITEARARGATVHELGVVHDPAGWNRGFFIRPTIVSEAPDDLRVVTEEQFGPVVPILRFTDEDEVLARANATEFGLCGSVWSSDEERAFSVARRVEAGVRFVNAHGLPALEVECPAGGVKQSGIGREFGLDGIRSFTDSIYITSRTQ